MHTENVINSLNKSLTSDSDDSILKEFIERIQTYIDGQKWIRKPITLSPSLCSQYGWKCIKPDMLECTTCAAKLSAHEPKIKNYAAYTACMEKMLSDLKDSHRKHCPWPLTPAPENFVRMILMPKEEALNQFMKRFKACLPFKASFPRIEDSVSNDLSFSDHQIATLCKMAGISSEETNNFGKSLVTLAATGWIIIEGHETEKSVFKCNSCQRSVWCGSFSLLESNKENSIVTEAAECTSESDIQHNAEDSKESSGEPPLKKKRISFVIKKGAPFNPLHEHRPWCLWIYDSIDDYASTSIKSASVATKLPSIPGWKIYLKSLLRNISDSQDLENNNPSKEHIRNARNLIEKWTDAI